MENIINDDFFITTKDKLYIKETEFNQPLVDWIVEKFGDDFNRETLIDKKGILRTYYTDFIIEKKEREIKTTETINYNSFFNTTI